MLTRCGRRCVPKRRRPGIELQGTNVTGGGGTRDGLEQGTVCFQDGDAFAVVWPLLGRHIAFHRRLVDLTDSVKAALLLSQAIYWTRHGRDIARTDGWFSKTAQQWEMETGLTEREQGGVRATLRTRELLIERRCGIPARLHFRLCTDRLVQALALRLESVAPVADQALLTNLLGPPIAYHRTLARITDGVHSGLLLSRALHLSRPGREGTSNGWIERTTRQWTDDLGLSRREQENARRVLARLGLWDETVAGIPPRLTVRVRMDQLAARLHGGDRTLCADARRRLLDGEDLAAGPRNVETVMADSGWPDSTKPPSQIRQNRHDSADETARSLIHESTSALESPIGDP